MKEVILNYLKTFGFIAIVFPPAFLTASFLKAKCSFLLTPKIHSIITLIGTVLLILAGLGKLGWSIQTASEQSQPEQLENAIFWVLTCSGMFIIFIEWSLNFFKK